MPGHTIEIQPASTRSLSPAWKAFVCLCLASITFAVYAPAGNHGFIDLDDDAYVTANPHVRTGLTAENLRWALTEAHSGNWHPVTWISHMVDCQLWGLDPRMHHLTSVGIHTANALLLFLVLCAMTASLWRSALVAALFAWHPLHVESVAWVAERKDVLSTFFWFTTLAAYWWYTRKPTWRRYLLIVVPFALGLMSKPMLVTLPFSLLLLDIWPLGRLKIDPLDALRTPAWRRNLWRLSLEKLPLLALVAASIAATIWAQQKAGAVVSVSYLSLSARVANATVAYVAYLGKLLWPANLAVYYPLPTSWPTWQVAGALMLLAAITALTIAALRRSPFLAVGWFWYLGTLVPVIGLVQVGNQAFADRYTYVPLIGVFIMAAWGVPPVLVARRTGRIAVGIVCSVVLSACLLGTSKQLSFWRDSVMLFERSLAVAPGAALLHNNLANVQLRRDRIGPAETHAREALRILPNFGDAHNTLGCALNVQGRFEEGIFHLEEATRLDPNLRPAFSNLALVRAAHPEARFRDGAQAISLASRAVKLTERRDAAAVDLLAMALAESGRFAEAIANAIEARDLAVSAGKPQLASAIESRLERYRRGRPYRVFGE